VNDVKFNFRNALIDHSYPFCSRRRDIDCAPMNERTAVIDTGVSAFDLDGYEVRM